MYYKELTQIFIPYVICDRFLNIKNSDLLEEKYYKARYMYI